MSDLAVGICLFAFLMVSYWLVRSLGGDARGRTIRSAGGLETADHSTVPATVSSEQVLPAPVAAAGTATAVREAIAQPPTHTSVPAARTELPNGDAHNEEASVVVVPKASATSHPAASAPSGHSVQEAILTLERPPQKPLASTTPLAADPALPDAPQSGAARVETSRVDAPHFEPARVEIIRSAPSAARVDAAPQPVPAAPPAAPPPAPAIDKAAADAARIASAAAAAVAAAAALAKASTPAQSAPVAAAPVAHVGPIAGRAYAGSTLPPGYTQPAISAPPKAFGDGPIELPATFQRASAKTTIAPPLPPITSSGVQQTKFEPLPPLKPTPVARPATSTAPSPVLPADWRTTVSPGYQRPLPASAPRAFTDSPVELPGHFTRADWMATLSPERRAALPPKAALPPPAGPVEAAVPTPVPTPAKAPTVATAVAPASAAAPSAPATVPAAVPSPRAASFYAHENPVNSPTPQAPSAASVAMASVAAAIPAALAQQNAARAAAAPVAAEAAVAVSPYTERAATLPRSDATAQAAPLVTPPAAAAPAVSANATSSAPSPVLVSTARRGTRVIGADAGDGDAIDLLAAAPPRPQSPSIWDTTTPRRAAPDDSVFVPDLLVASSPQSIKAERVPVRAESLLVRPDVARTLSPPAAAKPAAPAGSPGAGSPGPLVAPRPATPATNYSEIAPIPADRPLVSTASGTAGGHAISQARMGVEPPKPVTIAKPSVQATLPPGALGED